VIQVLPSSTHANEGGHEADWGLECFFERWVLSRPFVSMATVATLPVKSPFLASERAEL